MPASRKYDDETRARAVRMYRDRIADQGESMIEARRQIGALLDINPSTLRSWIERDEVDRGDRDGVTTAEAAEIRRHSEACGVAEGLRGREIGHV